MNPERARQRARWEHLSRTVPSVVRDLLDTIDVVGIRNETTEEVERVLFGWTERRDTSGGKKVRVDGAGAMARWRRALSTQRNVTLGTVRRLVDDAKETAHLNKVKSHEVGERLLAHHEAPEPRDGVLVVRPPQRRFPYFGLPGYLEATPVEIPVYVARRWQARTRKTSPATWDVTAGSNTVAEVLRTIFRAQVVASDIAETHALDACGSIGDLGTLPGHLSKRTPGSKAVPVPDLVFLDPPSRGRPTHSRIYNGAHPEADLASLDRVSYLHAIVVAVIAAVKRLAPGGLVSLLLREGVRDHQRVTGDPTLVEGPLGGLEDSHEIRLVEGPLGGLEDSHEIRLVERLRVEEPFPVNQASLGTTRYPMTHLLFERGAS